MKPRSPGPTATRRGWSAPLPVAIAWRYLRGAESNLLSGTARAAIAATALGVTAMVIAMALMTGYREDLQRKLIGGNAAVVVYPLGGEQPDAAATRALEAIPGVEAVAAVTYGQGTIASPAVPQGLEITVRGVDPRSDPISAQVTLEAPPSDAEQTPGPPAAALGAELAARLGVVPGESLRLALLGFRNGAPRFSFLSVRYAGSFRTGFSEFDRGWVVLDQARLRTALAGAGGASSGMEGGIGGGMEGQLLELRIADPARARDVAAAAETVLGESYLVSDWQDLNRELFSALRVQQWALFLVLGLIVLVSTFNVASTLVVLVRERRREIGVLAAMGWKPAGLRSLFLTYGAILGAGGIALGMACGAAAAWVLDTFHLIRFDAEVAAIYFISSVPFRLELEDLGAIVLFALLINVLACLVPAWRAARLDPAAALRYE